MSKTNKTELHDPFQIALEHENDYLRKLTVTVESTKVATERRRELTKIRKTTRIKGFRKGKVPTHVIEERYGPLIDERTLTALVNTGFRLAVEQHNLATIGEPVVSEVDYESGERLSFRVDVEVMPQINLVRIGDFRIERPEIEITEEAIGEMLEKVRSDRAILNPVERKPEDGDVVSVVIQAAPDSKDSLTETLSEEKPYSFEIGAGFAIPDGEEAIRTLEPGQDGTFGVSYPEDFGAETLAGTTQSLNIRLDDVRSKRLPEADDDFAREVGDFKTMDELRAAIEEDLLAHKKREADDIVQEKLIDSIIDANPFEVPPSLLSHYLERVLDAPDDADADRVEEARQSVTPAVERQIKKDLILENVIKSEGLEPSSEEFDEHLSEMGEARGLSLVEVRRQLAKEKQLEAVRHRLAIDRAFRFLGDRSEIT